MLTNLEVHTTSVSCTQIYNYQRTIWGEDGFDRGGSSSAATAARGIDPFLFLPAIAEPHPDHFLLHVELVSDNGNLVRGRFLVLLEEGKKARDSL